MSKKNVLKRSEEGELFSRTPRSGGLYAMLLALMLLPAVAWAQDLNISGTVRDASNEPVAGVSVVVKGTTKGAATDAAGAYSISAPGNATLVFSFLGMDTKEEAVNGRTQVDVQLAESSQAIDEVVVVGYGTVQRKNFTGSYASVSMENSPLALLPNTNPLDALRGTVAGLTITQPTKAGDSPSILVRGQKSINGGSDPLIVLDGIIYMGNLRDVDPATIASVTLLKDATTVAAYGSRAANGVIMVKTKSGQKGKPVVTANASIAVAQMINAPEVQSPEDYIRMANARQGKPEDTDPTTWMYDFEKENYQKGLTTDWLDFVTRTAITKNYTASVAGSTDKISYFLSGATLQQQGVVIGDDFSRNSFTGKIGTDITDWLHIAGDASYTQSDYSGATAGDIGQAIRMSPYGRPYRTGSDNLLEKYPRTQGALATNPLWTAQSGTIDDYDVISVYRMGGNLTLKCPWLKGLSYKLNYSYMNRYIDRDYFTHETNYVPMASSYAGGVNDPSRYSDATLSAYLSQANGYSAREKQTSWVMDNIINYTEQFDKHFVDVTLVYTRDYYHSDYKRIDGSDFSALGNTMLGYNGLALATTQKINSFSNVEQTNIGYLGRANYNYDNRYHFNASVRRDGASVFGMDNKWGVFPSVGVAWTASQEEFLQPVLSGVVDNLKIKASWGKNGNQALDPYQTLSRLAMGQTGGYSYPFDNANAASWGQRLTTIGNTSLAWETTTALNIGVELELFKRLTLNADFYTSETTDQIFDRDIPVFGSGITTTKATMGQVDNWGLELALTSVNMKTQGFEWSSSLSFYINRNTLVELYGDGKDDIANSLFLGKSLGVIYGYKPIGIVQETDVDYIEANTAKAGDVMFANLDGSEDGKITADGDRTILGYSKENFRMSFGNTLSYKNFELYFLFTGVFGGSDFYMASNRYAYLTSSDDFANNSFAHEWWTPENKSNVYPRADYSNGNYNPLQSRTFVRLQDLSLSYTFVLPERLHVKSLKAYVAAQNLLTITGWEGGDPEIAQTLDTYSYGYPLFATFSFGINLSF